MSKSYPLIKKPSKMIQLNIEHLGLVNVKTKQNGLTATHRKVINAFIHVIKNSQREGKSYKVDLRWLRSICNVVGPSNEEFIEDLFTLLNFKYSFRYVKDRNIHWEACVIFPRISAVLDINNATTDCIEFVVEPHIEERIKNIGKKGRGSFVILDQSIVSKFGSPYTIIVYEFIIDYSRISLNKELSLREFRDMLDLKDKYLDISELQRRVLLPIEKEINRHTNLNCKYSLKKSNGDYFIQWCINPEHKIPESSKDDEYDIEPESNEPEIKKPEPLHLTYKYEDDDDF